MITKNTIKFITTLILASLPAFTFANETVKTETNTPQVESVQLDIYKSPTCGCCGKWINHMKDEKFLTKAHNTNSLSQLKDEKGVPKEYRSCHTAVTKEGYIFEGHIPAKIVKRFLQEKPNNAVGLVVPGMPVGSPGMAYQNKFMPYEVLLINKDGSVSQYAKVNSEKEQY